jgi:hypothetical protein
MITGDIDGLQDVFNRPAMFYREHSRREIQVGFLHAGDRFNRSGELFRTVGAVQPGYPDTVLSEAGLCLCFSSWHWSGRSLCIKVA